MNPTMRKLFILLNLAFICQFTLAQEREEISDEMALIYDTTYWDTEFRIGLNFNQAAFSGNWKSGGVNSLAFGSILAAKANYKRDKFSWINQLELLYGVVKNEGQDTRKSNDRIFFDSKIGYKTSEHWGVFSSVNFITQFTEGYEYQEPEKLIISGFFSPAFLTLGYGMEYNPNEEFALRISPLSPRFTFVTDPEIINNVPLNYGVPQGRQVRTEWLAFQLFATWDKEVNENLSIQSRYQLFSNYETLAFKTIDHRLDLTITAKITRFVDVTFTSINVYDIDMDPGIQYSQALALGILYKVTNKK